MATLGYITQQIDDALSRNTINAHFPSFSRIETLQHKQYKKIVVQWTPVIWNKIKNTHNIAHYIFSIWN